MSSQLFIPNVVMIRHAQSEWNRAGRFTGWADPALTEHGRAEAVRAGHTIAGHGLAFDHVYTSRLRRARDTADIVLRTMGAQGIAPSSDWRLNERHYGALQGQDKAQMTQRVGEAQVWRWRRGYDDRPPPLPVDRDTHPSQQAQWMDIPRERLPNGESLAQTRVRVVEFWTDRIVPQLRAGRRLLIASHGNTLRALIMHLHGMRVAEVEAFEIPTGVPIVYAFSPDAEPIGWHYLKNDEQAAA